MLYQLSYLATRGETEHHSTTVSRLEFRLRACRMSFRECVVSFRDRHGMLYETRVDAETAFEAAALALKFWTTRRYIDGPGRHATLLVEIKKPAHLLVEVQMKKLLHWLYVRPPKTHEEALRVRRLRDLLADDRH